MNGETLGRRLKLLREQAGLSQAQLAAAAGIPIGTVRGAEYDRREPLVTTAGKLARALGVSLDELVGGASAESNAGGQPPSGSAAIPLRGRKAKAEAPGEGAAKKSRRKKGA